MRQLLSNILLIAALMLLAGTSLGQSVSIRNIEDRLSLGPFTTYYEDTTGTLGIDEIADPDFADEFRAPASGQTHFGLTRSAYWFQVALDWSPDTLDQAWVLEIGPPKHVEGIARGGTDIYFFNANDELEFSTRLGSLSSTNELKTLQGGYALQIDPLSISRVYVRVESAREMRVPITLWTEAAFRDMEINANTGFGLRYGMLIAMIFYNLFLFASIRERSFLFYSIAIISQLTFLFVDSKHARLVNENELVSPWLINMLERNIYTLMSMAHLQFQRHLLQLWQFNPDLDRVFRILIGLFGLALFISLIPDEKIVQGVYLPLIIIGLLLSFYTNIEAIRRGMDTARVHLLAMSTLLAGVGIQLLNQVFGLLPDSWVTVHALEMGMIAQALLLSFSLAFRYNAMKKEKEEAQRQAIVHLLHSEKIKDQILANVSHELRTPVHGINGLAEITLRDVEQLPERTSAIEENLQLISANGTRLIRLIDDLLDISSLRSKAISLNLESVNLRDLARSVADTVGAARSSNTVTLHNNIEADLPCVSADKDRLQQILLNLVANAVNSTPEGDVWISASLSGLEEITVSVKDNGVGITPDDMERIFQPFEKGTAAKGLRPGGTGLGLAISKHLVGLHGSTLEVVSVPGTGSVFSFRLPIAGDLPVAQDDHAITANTRLIRRADFSPVQPVAATSPETGESRILIVDDDAVNRRVMREQLQQYHVLEAAGGREALESVQNEKPDLVLLDLMMPDMDGYEVCTVLRQHYDQMQLPIIIVTARNHLEDLTEGFRAGANDYLSKPFHMEELRARVSSQLQLRELQRLNEENIRLRLHIQEYVKASQELRASRYQLERVLDSIQTPAIAIVYPGVIVHANPMASTLLHMDSSALMGENLSALLAEDEANQGLISLVSRWEAGDSIAEEERSAVMVLNCPAAAVADVRFQIRFAQLAEDDSTAILFFDSAPGLSPESRGTEGMNERELVKVLSEAQQNVRALNTRLKLITPRELVEFPQILEHFSHLDEVVGFLDENLQSVSSHDAYREQLVALMQLTLEVWEQTTGKTKIDLAEGSRIWAVSIDDGRLRTRTFDRYLRVDLLPKVPRWREVIRTAYFVLSDPEINPDRRSKLESELEKTKAVLQQSALI